MSMATQELVRRAWTELEKELDEHGYELVEVEYGQHGHTNILRIYIDKPSGISLDDCTSVSHFLSALLDKGEFVDERYVLEVSSPGIDRPIRKATDFRRFIGERIKVKTVSPVQGRKRFTGTLQGYSDGLVSMEIDGELYEVHVENVKRAKLDR